jgi:acyl-CoA synthetase (AMP-forming)/AMP-acid ligase II
MHFTASDRLAVPVPCYHCFGMVPAKLMCLSVGACGEIIYPREIDDLVFAHPEVAKIAVFGIPDDDYGEEIMTWIQLHECATATDAEIR